MPQKGHSAKKAEAEGRKSNTHVAHQKGAPDLKLNKAKAKAAFKAKKGK